MVEYRQASTAPRRVLSDNGKHAPPGISRSLSISLRGILSITQQSLIRLMFNKYRTILTHPKLTTKHKTVAAQTPPPRRQPGMGLAVHTAGSQASDGRGGKPNRNGVKPPAVAQRSRSCIRGRAALSGEVLSGGRLSPHTVMGPASRARAAPRQRSANRTGVGFSAFPSADRVQTGQLAVSKPRLPQPLDRRPVWRQTRGRRPRFRPLNPLGPTLVDRTKTPPGRTNPPGPTQKNHGKCLPKNTRLSPNLKTARSDVSPVNPT